MKTCKNCLTTDPLAFYETQGSLYCKPCHKQRYFQPGRDRLLQSKLTRAQCVDCGLFVTEENACVFDFDHLGDKAFNVSKMTTMCDARFEAEIAKCELCCANCHRLRTSTRPRVHPTPGRPRRQILNWAPF